MKNSFNYDSKTKLFLPNLEDYTISEISDQLFIVSSSNNNHLVHINPKNVTFSCSCDNFVFQKKSADNDSPIMCPHIKLLFSYLSLTPPYTNLRRLENKQFPFLN